MIFRRENKPNSLQKFFSKSSRRLKSVIDEGTQQKPKLFLHSSIFSNFSYNNLIPLKFVQSVIPLLRNCSSSGLPSCHQCFYLSFFITSSCVEIRKNRKGLGQVSEVLRATELCCFAKKLANKDGCVCKVWWTLLGDFPQSPNKKLD